jgi:hypothetical protein
MLSNDDLSSGAEFSIISIRLRAWALPKVPLGCLVDQPDGFRLALGQLNHRFAFPFGSSISFMCQTGQNVATNMAQGATVIRRRQ